MADTVYLKIDQNVEVMGPAVTIGDIGKVLCTNRNAEDKLKTIQIYKFCKDSPQKCVVSVLENIRKINEIYPSMQVENTGETDVLLELVQVNKYKEIVQFIKVVLVCLISFFGTSFTIIAFHNDVGITDVFSYLYENITGKVSRGCTILEVSYSIGLAVGMIVFFNHIGGRTVISNLEYASLLSIVPALSLKRG